jgi:hypothetical protein
VPAKKPMGHHEIGEAIRIMRERAAQAREDFKRLMKEMKELATRRERLRRKKGG